MNKLSASLLTTAIVTGLMAAQVAKADDTAAKGGDKAKAEKHSCKGEKGKDKHSCKGEKSKKDKNSCKNGCGEEKKTEEGK